MESWYQIRLYFEKCVALCMITNLATLFFFSLSSVWSVYKYSIKNMSHSAQQICFWWSGTKIHDGLACTVATCTSSKEVPHGHTVRASWHNHIPRYLNRMGSHQVSMMFARSRRHPIRVFFPTLCVPLSLVSFSFTNILRKMIPLTEERIVFYIEEICHQWRI